MRTIGHLLRIVTPPSSGVVAEYEPPVASQPLLLRPTTGVWYGYCAAEFRSRASEAPLSNASWITTTSLPRKKDVFGISAARWSWPQLGCRVLLNRNALYESTRSDGVSAVVAAVAEGAFTAIGTAASAAVRATAEMRRKAECGTRSPAE